MDNLLRYTPPAINFDDADGDEVSLSDFTIDSVVEYLEQEGYTVTAEDEASVTVTLTGSIQDAELAEAVAEAHQKHGHKLAELIRSL